MKGEHRGAEKGSRHSQASEDPVQEKACGKVKEDIRKMVAQRTVAPDPVLHPECAMKDGIILLRRTRLEPDSPKPVKRAQVRACHVTVVVPDESSEEGGPIGCERKNGHGDRCHSCGSNAPHGFKRSNLPISSQ
jgi:hypothetical protein